MDHIAALRRELHRHPELPGRETWTAARIERHFAPLKPDATLAGLGGTGLAFIFDGAEPGPTVMLRCELDALPIQEVNDFAHRSTVDGVSHKCGHEGHMAILAAVGERLAAARPRCGRVVLLYQPAEESGEGAAAVLADPRFASIAPDFAFALHNLPGLALGAITLRAGTFTCASRGMTVTLRGRTAHASQPETGDSPARAMCELIDTLDDLRGRMEFGDELAFATVVGASLGGEDAFGTAPADARVMATLRSESDATMARIVEFTEKLAHRLAARDRLTCSITYQDDFRATVNGTDAVGIVRRAAGSRTVTLLDRPYRFSEDFGRFTAVAEGAMFGIGAGAGMPELHNPDYDFPDALIPEAAAMFTAIVEGCLG